MARFIPNLSLSALAISSAVYCTDAFVSPAVSRPLRGPRPIPSVTYTTMVRRPIEEILLELKAKGISFPPTATRSELERLLSQADVATPNYGTESRVQDPWKDEDPRDDDSVNDVLSSRKKTRQTVEPMNGNRRRRQRRRQTSRIEFEEGDIDAVNRRENRRRRRQQQQQQQMSPLAAPADILFRVVDKTSKTVAQAIPEQVLDIGSKATRLASRTTQQFFHDLVDAGPPKKRKGIRRKKRLEDTTELRKSKVEQFSSPDTQQWQDEEEPHYEDHYAKDSSAVDEKVSKKYDRESTTKDTVRIQVPIQDILSELIRRDIRFPPTSTRAELEELLEQAVRSEEQTVTPPLDTASTDTATATQDQSHPSTTGTSAFASMDERQDNVWKKATRVSVKKIKTIPKKVSQTIGTRAKNTYQKARNSAASLFQDASDLMDNDDTPIIVDAIVEDISTQQLPNDVDNDDVIIDVEPIYRRDRGERYRPPGRKTTPSKASDDQFKTKPRRHRRMDQNEDARTTTFGQNTGQTTPRARLPRLSPAEQSQELESKRDRGRRSNGDRTIYSPYRKSNDIYVDGLDRFGDFVANSVDSFLWGSEKEKVTTPVPDSPGQSSNRRRKGNWKDKMEEQFDYLLGIHQDGEYYNRWVNEPFDNEQSTDDTTDVPNTGRRRAQSRKERQPYEKPIWEEDGSLLSMLFGTDKHAGLGHDMFYRSPSSYGSGSVVKILQTLLRTAALLVSGICRWASVRGSLPQPIVVVGVLSSILSSRPGSRVRNIIFTVLALRTAGELLHGYINDDTEFWDPIEDQDPDI